MAESFELAYKSSGLLFGGSAAVVPVWPQILVRDVIADDVVVGDKDIVAGRTDRFLDTAPTTDLGMMGSQVGALGAGGSLRRLNLSINLPPSSSKPSTTITLSSSRCSQQRRLPTPEGTWRTLAALPTHLVEPTPRPTSWRTSGP